MALGKSKRVDRAPVAPTRGALAFYAVCRAITVGFSHIYLPGPVIGREHLPATGPYILAPVHRSYVDWLVVARVTRRRLRYLVKGEVFESRVMGALLEALGAFPVNRGAPDRAALNQALAVLGVGEPLVIFPEGTRQSGPAVEELREGAVYLALRGEVPIVPVGVAGTERAMGRGSVIPRPGRVFLVVGAPIYPVRRTNAAGETQRVGRSETHELNEALRQAIEEAFAEATRRLASPGDRGRASRVKGGVHSGASVPPANETRG